MCSQPPAHTRTHACITNACIHHNFRVKMLLATFNRPNVTYDIRYKRLLQDEDVDADITKFLSSRKEECGIICEP